MWSRKGCIVREISRATYLVAYGIIGCLGVGRRHGSRENGHRKRIAIIALSVTIGKMGRRLREKRRSG